MEALNEYGEEKRRVVIAFDEAQYLRFGGATKYDGIIAYAVDNLKNLTFILTGSEVGLLFDSSSSTIQRRRSSAGTTTT
ncbi:hypothetical protein [Thermococcus piezophilus]|uniref:hypothetical protein n=1 Tax=Thermococcus piezophilus TaxID=1712654 RepID=UPI000A892CD9|nr:hypothetical protein [Thermococcus piezophilus]